MFSTYPTTVSCIIVLVLCSVVVAKEQNHVSTGACVHVCLSVFECVRLRAYFSSLGTMLLVALPLVSRSTVMPFYRVAVATNSPYIKEMCAASPRYRNYVKVLEDVKRR